MRLFEFADAESQMELWKLITDSVWQAIYKQTQEQKQLDAQSAKSPSAAPKQPKPFKQRFLNLANQALQAEAGAMSAVRDFLCYGKWID